MIKRYIAEPGSDAVIAAMRESSRWLASRVAYIETARALARARGFGAPLTRRFRDEWAEFEVVDLDQVRAERAAVVADEEGLRTLDAIHLASALTVPTDALLFATWDRDLHAAAARRGLRLLPESLP